ncbi:MAG: flavodoxin family protein, partial [Clostridia bacterium]|nr:flavodoxin family protein [Clostridia bacterium]
MKDEIVILNGSPRGAKSNTLMVSRALTDGIRQITPGESRVIDIRELNILPCRGCFGCWTASSGRCVIDDDMKQVMDAVYAAKTVIVSFPVYFYGLPGPVKTALDRMLPVMYPSNGGPTLHRVRPGMENK